MTVLVSSVSAAATTLVTLHMHMPQHAHYADKQITGRQFHTLHWSNPWHF
jgi:hypothetical protein